MTPRAQLVCPTCKVAIVQETAQWRCPKCSRVFSENRGVLSFLSPEERFNEGAYEDKQNDAWTYSARLRDKIRHSKLLSLLNLIRIRCSLSGRRDRLFYDEMRHGSKDRLILDIGCGGGRHYFCDYGTVIGLEPVIGLATFAKQIYHEVYQGNALALPFADNSFDYVVSSDVVGHIVKEDKDRLFSEMYRVLKKGGRTVHVIETDATNPMVRWAHRYPDLFREHFVDKPGHVGLELPSELKARFEKHGFKVVKFMKLCSRVQEFGIFVAFFDNEFKTKSKLIHFLVEVDRLFARSFVVKELLHFPLEPLAIIDGWLTPLDYGHGMLVVFEK